MTVYNHLYVIVAFSVHNLNGALAIIEVLSVQARELNVVLGTNDLTDKEAPTYA